MNIHECEQLQEELEHFKREKEKIRMVVGQIGGKQTQKTDKIINYVFLVAIALLFVFDTCRHMCDLPFSVPQVFSLQLGILLVSIKIIWMMHRQMKVGHFQFWILNSIEFRLNSIGKKVQDLEKKIEASEVSIKNL